MLKNYTMVMRKLDVLQHIEELIKAVLHDFEEVKSSLKSSCPAQTKRSAVIDTLLIMHENVPFQSITNTVKKTLSKSFYNNTLR